MIISNYNYWGKYQVAELILKFRKIVGLDRISDNIYNNRIHKQFQDKVDQEIYYMMQRGKCGRTSDKDCFYFFIDFRKRMGEVEIETAMMRENMDQCFLHAAYWRLSLLGTYPDQQSNQHPPGVWDGAQSTESHWPGHT